MSTATTEYAKEIRRRRVAAFRAKCVRRWIFKIRCVDSGIQAKAKLIREGKGKNGQSMSPELLARHGIV